MDESTTKRCTIEDCGRITVARGWCNRHYKRWKTHGDPTITMTPTLVQGTPEERFWAKVDAFGDCWEWTAYRDKDGYGILSFVPAGLSTRAHKFAWQTLVGPIPDGLELDHRCRNRGCCNPDHLEPVTHAENMRRSGLLGQWTRLAAKNRTHCQRNHPYAGENLVMDSGSRRCRQCRNDGQNSRRRERTQDAQ